MRTRRNKIRVGITMGDPSGIGPAIIRKAINKVESLADFLIIGDKWVFGRAPGIKFIDLDNVCRKSFKFGRVKAEYGRASVEYLDKAIELIGNNEIDCLVTCPVSKEAVSLSGLSGFSGHTEYLAARTNTKHFLMMLLNKKLRYSLVTRHIPLKDVPSELRRDKIYKTILLTHRYMKELFLIRDPRLAVCGLNPHASDNGLLGREENKIIKPALERFIKDTGVVVDGPLPADTVASNAAKRQYDCIVAMYHDQALIPLKMSGEQTGVNLTAGLPFVRTSPLHGTAFDIADKFNLARPESLIEAIRLAVKCALNQRKD